MRAIKNLLVPGDHPGRDRRWRRRRSPYRPRKAVSRRNDQSELVAVSAAGIYNYAVRVGSKVMLFDTGADPGGHPVDAALAALGAGRNDVSDVFLTHGHGDHTAGAAGLGSAKIASDRGTSRWRRGRRFPTPWPPS